MVRASRLDVDVLKELKEDKRFTGQAVAVLVLAALSLGIGYTVFIETWFQAGGISLYGLIVGSLANMISSCFSAFLWSITTFLVGTKLFQGRTRYWELARPLFFSATPGVLLIFISIPVPPLPARNGMLPFYWFQAAVTVVSIVWLLLAQAFALKQAMGFDVQRTLLTVGVGFLILVFLGLSFAPR